MANELLYNVSDSPTSCGTQDPKIISYKRKLTTLLAKVSGIINLNNSKDLWLELLASFRTDLVQHFVFNWTVSLPPPPPARPPPNRRDGRQHGVRVHLSAPVGLLPQERLDPPLLRPRQKRRAAAV